MSAENKHRFSKDEILRTINTVLLTAIGIIILNASVWIRNMEVDRKDDIASINMKMDNIMIAALTNTNSIAAHEKSAQVMINKIQALDEGTSIATADRITKTEAIEAIEYLRRWVEKNYERKNQ
jgi:low affinity Fe/Cu permease